MFFIAYSIGLGILLLVMFAILKWLGLPAGHLIDWLIGIASFWWLVVIVTVPWNVYFDAQEVLAESAISKSKNIPVEDQQIRYVLRVARWSIVIAIALHLLSALALYLLAVTGISAVGYLSSVATLLFTALRPAIRAYQYIARRLSTIRQQISYPREDILELRNRFAQLEEKVKHLDNQLDTKNSQSWATLQEQKLQSTRQELNYLRASLEQFQSKNQVEHEELSRQSQNAIAQLTEDSQVLGHVREIIRFFKTA